MCARTSYRLEPGGMVERPLCQAAQPRNRKDRLKIISSAQQKTITGFAPRRPPKRYLFGPGPGMAHPRVYEALSKPIVGHLDPYFIEVMNDIQQLLKTVFGTSEGVTMAISATVSGGMESAVS